VVKPATSRRWAANGGPSAYGAFDMSGNVREWNDLDGNAGLLRGLRGGAWDTTNASNVSRTGRTETNPSNDLNFYGFRLASPVAVPEPSTWVMSASGLAFCGLGSVAPAEAGLTPPV